VGQQLVRGVFGCIAGGPSSLPLSRVDDRDGGSLAGILWILLHFCPQQTQQWMVSSSSSTSSAGSPYTNSSHCPPPLASVLQ
jgi:hypothetical protein